MDFKQLEAFAQVVRLRSFSRAAETLFLTQPTVSAHIASLERELETKLVERTPKEALPSETGKVLYEYALEMLALRDRAIIACKEGEYSIGVVTIAASTIPHKHLLPGLMSAFRIRYPEASFSVLSSDSLGVVEEISRGGAEIGLTGTKLRDPRSEFIEYASDDLVVVVPTTPEYSHLGESVSAADLVKYPFIIRESGSGTRKETEDFLRAKGIRPETLQIAAQLDDQDAVIKSVGEGLGVAILSRLAAADYERFGSIRILSLDGGVIARKLYLVRHAKRQLSMTAEAFWAFAQEYGRRMHFGWKL